MSVGLPISVWRRTSGNGELGTTDESITTLDNVQITTLSGLSLVALEGSYTPTPATEWEVDDDIPSSEWRPTDGLSEFGSGEPSDIVDTEDVSLVDTEGVQIVDTGVIETLIPSTEWEENDGA